MTKILQISDTHIVPEGQLAYGQVDTATALAQCVETINRLLPAIGPVDGIIVTGDLTDFGTTEDYERFKSLMAPLDTPYRAVPGNHDHRETMRKAFAHESWMPATGPIQWHMELADFTLIGLDSHVAGAAHGEMGNDTLSYLQQVMQRAAGQPLLIGFHHPPVLTGLHIMDQHNLREHDKLAAILSGYPGEIRLLCGHVHRAITASFAGHVCLTAPGSSHAVTIDLREDASNSLTMEPGGFMLHEWRNGCFVCHVIPVGHFEGPYPFYSD